MIYSQTRLLSVFNLTSAFYLLYFGAVGVYIIFLPKLLMSSGYNPFEIGVLFAAGPIMRFLVPFLFLKHIKLTNKVFRFSLIASIGSTLLFIIFHSNFTIALIAMSLMGIFWSLVLPFVESLALETIGKRYGSARVFGSIGFILTALFLGHTTLNFDSAMIFYIVVIMLTVVAGFLLSRNMEPTTKDEPSGFDFGAHTGFWATVFLMQVSFGGFYNFFTIYAENHNIPLSTISYLWVFGVVAEIGMFLWQKRILHIRSNSLLRFAMIITAVRWLLLYLFADLIAIYYISQFLHAFSLALFHTVAIIYIQENYKNARLGQQFYLGIGYGLGAFIGSVISGIVYGDMLFLYMAIFAFIGYLTLLKTNPLKLKTN